MKYLLIMVVMSTIESGTVSVISVHDTISECHLAKTQHGFDQPMQSTFCLTTQDGGDWRLE